MAKKFTYDEHKKRIREIIERPKPTSDRRGALKKLLEVAKAKRA